MKLLRIILLVLISIYPLNCDPTSTESETIEEITLEIYKISGVYDSDLTNDSDTVQIHIESTNGEPRVIIRNLTEIQGNLAEEHLLYPILELYNKTMEVLNRTDEVERETTIVPTYTTELESDYNTEGYEEDPIVRNISERMMSYMDTSVDPCDDFYEYACGNFESVHDIPDDETTYDTTTIAIKEMNHLLRAILEDYDDHGGFEGMSKVKTFYSSCMDMSSRNKRGLKPLLDFFNMLGGWHLFRDNWDDERDFDWLTLIAQIAFFNIDILFAQHVSADVENPEVYVLSIDQIAPFPIAKSDIESNSTLLDDYADFIAETLELMGVPSDKAAETSEDILYFGIELSRIQIDKLNLTSLHSVMERLTIDELQRSIPGINWKRYFKIVLQRSINSSQVVNVDAKDFMYQLPELILRTDPKTLVNFIYWKLLEHVLPYLDDRFDMVRAKWIQASTGSKSLPDRWDVLLDFILDTMSKPVSSVYIQKHFDMKTKNDSMEIAVELQQAFRAIIEESDVLDEATKVEAMKKADGLHFLIGYADKLLSTEKISEEMKDLVVFSDKCFENVLHVLRFYLSVDQKKLGQMRDLNEWAVDPTIINAFYSPSKNVITIPAAHLQPPFFHPSLPKSYIFGGIGTTIGHEITHGFDRSGRMFDEEGRIENKWTNASIVEFERRAQCFIDQYNHYSLHGENIRGKATENENIADAGGIRISYHAYQNWLERTGSPPQRFAGLNLTDKQTFFLSYVHGWCAIERRESAIALIKSDPHTPSKFRAIGPLQNSLEFAKAFSCPVGSPMNPLKKCVIW